MTPLDSVSEDIRWRQALYGGLLGSAGVVLAWMVWVVIQAWLQSWVSVVRAPAVGASVGLLVDFLATHVRTSAREARGEPEPVPPAPQEAKASGRLARVLKSVGAFSLVFLAGACENLVGDRIAALWQPFLVSVATFFPVGAVCAWMLHARNFSSHSLPANLLWGGYTGLCAATTVVGMGWLLGTLPRVEADVDWRAILSLFGWWGLLGAAFGFTLREEDAPSPLGPALGVGCMLVLTLLGAVPVSWLSESPKWLELLARVARPVSEVVLTHPGLPGQVLTDVEQASGAAPLAPPQQTALGILQAVPTPDWSRRVTRLLGCGRLVAVKGPPLREVPWSELTLRHHALCADLERGSRSGLLRSWLVLLVFSLGLGLAHVGEARLRPATYAGSGTQRRDGILAAGALLFLLAAVLTVRFVPA